MLISRGSKNGVVLLDGERPNMEMLEAWVGECELFICADGAANGELPRRPDAIVGDMDSLLHPPEEVPLIRMADVDMTDGEKCILHLRREGCDRVVLLGGTGGRQDHHLVNLALPLSQPGEILLAGEDFFAVGVRGKQAFHLPPSRGLSVFPLHGSVQGVTLKGVEFPLEGADLAVTGGLTASNRSVDSRIEIEILQGRLLLIVERAPGDPLWMDPI